MAETALARLVSGVEGALLGRRVVASRPSSAFAALARCPRLLCLYHLALCDHASAASQIFMGPATDSDMCSSSASSLSRNNPNTRMERTDDTQEYTGDCMEMETTDKDSNEQEGDS
jgi:hypothetical protein